MRGGSLRHDLWRYLAGLAACAVLGWFAFVQGTRVPLLSFADLGFHELGHMLTYPFPDVVTAIMGSVTQVAVPLGLAAYFARTRHQTVSVALMLAWAGTSAQDASVYIADAPYERLPLIGGEHDWAFLLGPENWDALDSAGTSAAAVKGLGAILLVLGMALCLHGLINAVSLPRRRRRGRVEVPHSGRIRPARIAVDDPNLRR